MLTFFWIENLGVDSKILNAHFFFKIDDHRRPVLHGVSKCSVPCVAGRSMQSGHPNAPELRIRTDDSTWWPETASGCWDYIYVIYIHIYNTHTHIYIIYIYNVYIYIFIYLFICVFSNYIYILSNFLLESSDENGQLCDWLSTKTLGEQICSSYSSSCDDWNSNIPIPGWHTVQTSSVSKQ